VINETGGEDAPDKPKRDHRKKKRKVGFQLAQALLCVNERKKHNYHVDYKSVAARFQVSPEGLRVAYCQWKRGDIDLGIAEQTEAERAVDLRMQHVRTLELVNRHVALVLVHYEGALVAAEEHLRETGTGTRRGKKVTVVSPLDPRGELNFLSTKLARLLTLRAQSEEGYNSYLEALTPQRHVEKQINPQHPAPIDVQTHVITANDEQRGLEILRARHLQHNPPPETPPAAP
jgi:hypothetical protein